MRRPRLLLYRTGDAALDVVRDVGNYPQWFARVLGDRADLLPHFACTQPHPDEDLAARADAVVITGSPQSLVEPEPWMDDACDFLRGAAAAGKPVLGVCFGHQLLGRAFGGRVRKNPRGWEAGTNEVVLTDEGRRDPLFAGVPPALGVNQSHRDEVEVLGEGCVRLAGGAHSDVQALGWGAHVRGVQFHPEMNGAIIRRVIRSRHAILTEDAERTGRAQTHHAGALHDRASDTPDAERVVLNFIEHFAWRA